MSSSEYSGDANCAGGDRQDEAELSDRNDVLLVTTAAGVKDPSGGEECRVAR